MNEQQINQINHINPSLLNVPKKHWPPLALKIAVGAVIVLILGTGIALASRAWDPLWNPFRPSPEKVLKSMVENMDSISSVHMEADFKMDSAGKSYGDTSFLLKFSGDSDASNPQNTKSDGKLTIGLGIQGIQLSGEASYILSGKDLFVMLSSLPNIPFLPIDLSSLKGKWIKMTELSNNTEKSGEIMDIVKSLNDNGTIVLVKKELADEKIGDVNAYHYIVGLKEEGIKEFVKILLKETSDLTTSSDEDIQTQADEIAQKIGALEIEHWIGKKDNLLRKSKIEARIMQDNAETLFSLTINLSDFNKPVSVKTPDIYTNAEDLIKDFAPLLEGITK